jgi:hypothetical protein
MPSWQNLNPSTMVHELPIVWAYRYDRITRRFTGRLAGDKICQIFGKNFRGLPLEEVHPPQALPWVQTLLSRVVLEPAVYRGTGRVFRQLDRYGLGERIVLPLSTDGVEADGILGATEYHYPRASDVHPTIDEQAEAEEWFALRAKHGRQS